jgi:hypothetical protein
MEDHSHLQPDPQGSLVNVIHDCLLPQALWLHIAIDFRVRRLGPLLPITGNGPYDHFGNPYVSSLEDYFNEVAYSPFYLPATLNVCHDLPYCFCSLNLRRLLYHRLHLYIGIRKMCLEEDERCRQDCRGRKGSDQGCGWQDCRKEEVELSDYKYMSYIDVKTAVFGRGLVGLEVSKADVFHVYAQTGYAQSSLHIL